LPHSQDVSASQRDETVLQVAIRNKIHLSHTCGGFGTCGTCRVFIKEGLEKMPPRNEIEQEIASDRSFQDFERLACQCSPINGLVIEIPEDPIV
jgi:2Fe-2S ferredoxin